MEKDSGVSISLCPSQLEAIEFLKAWSTEAPVLHLSVDDGFGRTTILREFQKATGGHWLDVRDFVAQTAAGHPLAIEEATWRILTSALERFPLVIVDDFHKLADYVSRCNGYSRGQYVDNVMKAVQETAAEKNCRLLIGSDGNLPGTFDEIDWPTWLGSFSCADYEHLFPAISDRTLDQVDFQSVYRFAPHLNCRRIESLCMWIRRAGNVSTEELLNYIQANGMSSNVEIEEVQQVKLRDLCGVDQVIEALEDNVILPMENIELATRLGLTPKRGVMLVGPPGTGKTTIGRALARRLRGKFFVIDGTVISGTQYFYHRIDSIFHRATRNAPSVVFIDDSDVIFESGREHGLYRYLLTILDGLESKSVNDVCVMMTAMDLGNIPPALVRSGRIELWLEMKLPDGASRKRLLSQLFRDQVAVDSDEEWPGLIEATESFSGADLKRLVQDAKLRMAIDIARERSVEPFSRYLLQAAGAIRKSRGAYVQAAQRAAAANVDRPRWFNVHPELLES